VLGDTEIECVRVPGHTPGAMAYFFQIEDRGRGYTVGIHGGPGINTLTVEYLQKYGLPLDRRADYLASLQRLKGRSVDVFIGAHPGQNDTLGKRARLTKAEGGIGGPTGEGQNPFVDETAWPAFLAGLEQSAGKAFASS
jgi:metallo-beta-lactamase class B